MKRVRAPLVGVLVLTLGLAATTGLPAAKKGPDEAALKAIADKTARLGKALASLRKQGLRDPLLADLEVFHKAAVWIVRHQEFFQPDSPAWTLAVLDRGLLRASLAAQGESPWLNTTGSTVVHGYRSRIDGSVQPYAVTLPEAFGKDPNMRWRVDVVLHGRDATLTEVKFLQNNSDKPAPRNQDWVQIDVYGRGNNAYRWAGETDVFEAIDAFSAVERLLGRDKLLDPARVVLRGFSMGGGGTWHIGLHTPDRWCVLGPGAGFTTTHGFASQLPEQLPPWQEKCLHIYDAVDYAENAFDVPIVAYAGSDDAQLKAARNIEARLKGIDFPVHYQLLLAPGLKHAFPPEWQAKAEAAYAPFIAKGREEYPQRVRFVTYTMRYPTCDWVDIVGLEQHYEKALVDADKTETGYTVKTANVRSLHLTLPVGSPQALVVNIDGQAVHTRPWINSNGTAHVYLHRHDKTWTAVLPQRLLTERNHHPRKSAGLQGPIDDAFTESFLCVRGTEKPWHEATAKYAEANLRRFSDEWNKYCRGELPVKDDLDVTNEDIAGKHLILFGDPASNSLIAQVLDGLPLHWSRETMTLGGKTFASAEHVPVLIYPSPLNASRYVVLNSGHTFHAADFQGTNALLFPRLGDYAVLRLAPTEQDSLAADVATAGLFDDSWQIGKK